MFADNQSGGKTPVVSDCVKIICSTGDDAITYFVHVDAQVKVYRYGFFKPVAGRRAPGF